MSWLTPSRRFDPAVPEFTERTEVEPALLLGEIRALEWINGRDGHHRRILSYVEELLKDQSLPAPLRVIDLGTGSADVPRAIAAWARQRQRPVEIIAVDGNPRVVEWARERCADWPEIQVEQHN